LASRILDDRRHGLGLVLGLDSEDLGLGTRQLLGHMAQKK